MVYFNFFQEQLGGGGRFHVTQTYIIRTVFCGYISVVIPPKLFVNGWLVKTFDVNEKRKRLTWKILQVKIYYIYLFINSLST